MSIVTPYPPVAEPVRSALQDRGSAMSESAGRLVTRAQNGDPAAFEALVRHYQDMAYAVAYQILGNGDDAQDACQESFIKLYRKIGRYRSRHPFSTWLYRLVVNTALDHRRGQKRHRHVSLEDVRLPASVSTGSHQDLRLSLDRILENLSPKQRAAFVLRDLQGFPLNEITGILNCSAVTVRVHLHNARRRIRKELERDR